MRRRSISHTCGNHPYPTSVIVLQEGQQPSVAVQQRLPPPLPLRAWLPSCRGSPLPARQYQLLGVPQRVLRRCQVP